MQNTAQKETATALQNEWGLVLPDTLTKEEILELLAARLLQILQKGAEAFFQLMYRLDISEKKLNAVLHNDDAALDIARLIYDRQLQKIQSRLDNRSQPTNDDPDLSW